MRILMSLESAGTLLSSNRWGAGGSERLGERRLKLFGRSGSDPLARGMSASQGGCAR